MISWAYSCSILLYLTPINRADRSHHLACIKHTYITLLSSIRFPSTIFDPRTISFPLLSELLIPKQEQHVAYLLSTTTSTPFELETRGWSQIQARPHLFFKIDLLEVEIY